MAIREFGTFDKLVMVMMTPDIFCLFLWKTDLSFLGQKIVSNTGHYPSDHELIILEMIQHCFL